MKHILKYLLFATVVAALTLTACERTDEKLTNAVSFSAGDVVGYAVASQFMAITSDEGWSIETTYLAPEDAADWCTLSRTEGTGKANIVMTFGRNTLDVERKASFDVKFASGQTITCNFTQRAYTTSIVGTHPDWLELPSVVTDDDHIFVTHYLPDTDGGGRSFSILYDTEYYIPHWVAYTLHTTNVGSGARSNEWSLDPLFSSAQQADMRNAMGNGYTRGHMIPSASRLTSTAANAQTFYSTNMTPQDYTLNAGNNYEGRWVKLEDLVRRYKGTGTDTLYVVTGAVLQTVGGNEKIITVNNRNDGKRVAVPNYYYKALLRLVQRSGEKSYQAIAFWLKHEPLTGDVTTDDAITIDRLEELTGIDFFSNLDKETETAVEATYNPSYWGLK